MMAPNLDGLVYLMTVPAGVAGGLLVSLTISLLAGPTWWLLAPPVVGFWAGIKGGEYLSR